MNPRDGLDTLILVVDIWDEEGDLGLDWDENNHPYNRFYYVRDSTFNDVKFSESGYSPPFYLCSEVGFECFRDSLNSYENRPEEFSCDDYEITYPRGDTVYVFRNENYNNVFIDFYRVDNQGKVEEFRYEDISGIAGCGINFDGRYDLRKG